MVFEFPEDRGLFRELTVWENVLLPLELNGQMDAQGLARASGLDLSAGGLEAVKAEAVKLAQQAAA